MFWRGGGGGGGGPNFENILGVSRIKSIFFEVEIFMGFFWCGGAVTSLGGVTTEMGYFWDHFRLFF